MSIKTISKLMIVFSLVMFFAAIVMDTTVELGNSRIHNIGLLSQQQNFLIISVVVFLAGIILFSTAKLKQTPEDEMNERSEASVLVKKVDSTIRNYWIQKDLGEKTILISVVMVVIALFMDWKSFEILNGIKPDSNVTIIQAASLMIIWTFPTVAILLNKTINFRIGLFFGIYSFVWLFFQMNAVYEFANETSVKGMDISVFPGAGMWLTGIATILFIFGLLMVEWKRA